MSTGFSFPLAIDEIQIGHWVFALLRRFNVEHGATVLLVTQNTALTARYYSIVQVTDGVVSK